MAQRPTLSGLASVAEKLEGDRLHAPSAARNARVIADMLVQYAPVSGRALELASGTGQHVVAFAEALPGLIWQPSEIDAERRASIDAWVKAARPGNLRPVIALDAATPGWSRLHGGQDLIILVNLMHLIRQAEAQILIDEVGKALAPGGRFVLYGPFLRGGIATSDGDARFHADLQARDPDIGYKNDADIRNWLNDARLAQIAEVEMPANNLVFVSEAVSEMY